MVEYLSGNRIQGSSIGGSATPTHEDDFNYANQSAGDTEWVRNDTVNNKMRYNNTNKNLDFNYDTDNSNDSIGTDLGSNLNDSSWVVRFKLVISTLSTGGSCDMYIGMSSVSETSSAGTSQQFIGVDLKNEPSDQKFGGNDGSSGTLVRAPQDPTANGSLSVRTYFMQITRLTATTYTIKIFDDSYNDSALLYTIDGTSDSITSLRYFVLRVREASGSAVIQGTIDDLKIWDGVTTTLADEKASITNVPNDTRYEETDTRKIYRRDTYGWKPRLGTEYGDGIDPFRGCFCGGQNSTNLIDFITIESAGNATSFGGVLTANTGSGAGCDDNSRGVIGHGGNSVMDWITISTGANADDFGDRNNTSDEIASCSDQTTRGIFAGGTGYQAGIDWITIQTTANADEFGDLQAGRSAPSGCGDTTRGLIGGGSTGSIVNTIDYITFATTSDASDFGDLSETRRHQAATQSETRGVFAGGHPTYATIDYVVIQNKGTATDYGDLANGRYGVTGVSNYIRAVFGSSNVGGVSNQMDYITIANGGTATDFGDLTVARSNASGVSGN